MWSQSYADWGDTYALDVSTGITDSYTRTVFYNYTAVNNFDTTVYSTTNTTVYSGLSIGTDIIYSITTDTYYSTTDWGSFDATVFIDTYIRSITTSATGISTRPFYQIVPYYIIGNLSLAAGTDIRESLSATTVGSTAGTTLVDSGLTGTQYFTFSTYTTVDSTIPGVQFVSVSPPSAIFVVPVNAGAYVNTVVYNIGRFGPNAQAFQHWTTSAAEVIWYFNAGPGATGVITDLVATATNDFTLYGHDYFSLVNAGAGLPSTSGYMTQTVNDVSTHYGPDTTLYGTNLYLVGNTTGTYRELGFNYFPDGLTYYLDNGDLIVSTDSDNFSLEFNGKTTYSIHFSSSTWTAWTYGGIPSGGTTTNSSTGGFVNNTLTDMRGYLHFNARGDVPGSQGFLAHYIPTNMSALAPFSQTNLDVVYRGLQAQFLGDLAFIDTPLDIRPLFSSVRPGVYSIMLDQSYSLESIRTFWIEPDFETTTGFTSTVEYSIADTSDTGAISALLQATAYRSTTTTLSQTVETDPTSSTTISMVASGGIILNLIAPFYTQNLVSYTTVGYGGFLGTTSNPGGNYGVGTEKGIDFPAIGNHQLESVTRNGLNGAYATYTTIFNTTSADDQNVLTFASEGWYLATLYGTNDPYHENYQLLQWNRYFADQDSIFNFSANQKSIYSLYYRPMLHGLGL